MKVYSYSEARQKFAKVLDLARTEEVVIRKRSGELFSLAYKKPSSFPFDVKGVQTRATTKDILEAVEASRSGESPVVMIGKRLSNRPLTPSVATVQDKS